MAEVLLQIDLPSETLRFSVSGVTLFDTPPSVWQSGIQGIDAFSLSLGSLAGPATGPPRSP